MTGVGPRHHSTLRFPTRGCSSGIAVETSPRRPPETPAGGSETHLSAVLMRLLSTSCEGGDDRSQPGNEMEGWASSLFLNETQGRYCPIWSTRPRGPGAGKGVCGERASGSAPTPANGRP